MIETYLQQIDALLSSNPLVSEVQILRRSIRDTELEKVLNYRYRVTLADGGFVEMTERVLEVRSSLEVTKYRHHWQASTGKLIKRWDNAPHHPEIDTFPDHLHDGAENQVVNQAPINGLEVLRLILDELE
ncbi:MAG: hypothetical protein J4F29_14890 [Candidatus Latescibacteria bacterium]|nr:hypothetical protein [Candidatus Latescibacterota bacterium]